MKCKTTNKARCTGGLKKYVRMNRTGEIRVLCRSCRNTMGGSFVIVEDDREAVMEAARNMATRLGLVNLTRAGLCKTLRIGSNKLPLKLGEIVEALRGSVPLGDSVGLRRGFREVRKAFIVAKAVEYVKVRGFNSFTRAKFAKSCGMSESLTTYYFTMDQLRDEVVAVARRDKIYPILVQASGRGYFISKQTLAEALSNDLCQKPISNLQAGTERTKDR